MTPALAVAIAVVFGWTGLLIGVSFVEAPIKFRAPGVTLQIGLGIGRLVFRVVNTIEVVTAAALVVALLVAGPDPTITVAAGVAVVTLLVQLVALRPRMSRRAEAVRARPDDVPRSRVHHGYVALECVKLVALLVAGTAALALV